MNQEHKRIIWIFTVPKRSRRIKNKMREFVETTVMPREVDYDYTIGRLPEQVAQDLRQKVKLPVSGHPIFQNRKEDSVLIQ